MQHALFFVQQNLRHALARAIEQAKSEPESTDSFFKALNQSLSWFAYTLPSLLPIDWITRNTMLPFASEIRLEKKWGAQHLKPGISHPLIREIKKGKLVLAHPLKHVVKPGESLWQIAQSVRSGSVNAATIRKWNLLPDDILQPGQELWLCNPDDALVKDIGRHFKKQNLTAKNPAIPIDRLSPKIANNYVGLERQEYLLMIKLSFRGKLSENIHPLVVAAQQGVAKNQIVPWAPPKQAAPVHLPDNNPFSSYFAATEKQHSWLKPKPLQEHSGIKAPVLEKDWHGYPQTRQIKPPTPKAIPVINLNKLGAVAQESWELALGCLVTTGDFMNGAANAISSNATTIPSVYGGTVSIVMREDRSNAAFELGQQFGDTFSLVQGVVEGVAGALIAIGGEGAAIITSPTVVGTVAGTTVAAGGVFIASHGMNTAQNAVGNLVGERKKDRVNSAKEQESKTPEKATLIKPDSKISSGKAPEELLSKLKKPSDAHSVKSIKLNTRFGGGNRNTMKTVAKGDVNLESDYSDIISGNATFDKTNQTFTTSTGRIYGYHPDNIIEHGSSSIYPIKGQPGEFVNLSQAEFDLLKKTISNNGLNGNVKKALDGMRAKGNPGIDADTEKKLLHLLNSLK